jgi:phospholipid/cholesterol/gamma-HCH transport system substrate-binding protein
MAGSAAETVIGALVLGIAGGFLVYAGQSAGFDGDSDTYTLKASFRSAEGIAVGTDVRLAGIKIGAVTGLELDYGSYEAIATLAVDRGLELPEDSDVKIASEGLLGGSFVEVTPGASEFALADGDEFLNTQGSVSLLNLLMRFGTSNQ